MHLLSAAVQASCADLWPAAEAGVTCEHYIRNLWRNSAGNEASQSVAGSVCEGGRQQKPGEEAQSERRAFTWPPKAFEALDWTNQNSRDVQSQMTTIWTSPV